MKSPAYWNAWLYRLFLKFVWRKSEVEQLGRWKKVTEWIPRGSRVVELAAGTGQFYTRMLSGHVGDYLALDINPAFVQDMRAHGIAATQADLRTEEIPDSDVVLMISALYHFKDHQPEFLKKLLASAGDRLIIVEPLSRRLNRRSLYDRLRAKMVDIGEGPIFQRYTEEELLGLCRDHARVLHFERLPGNECLVVMAPAGSGWRQ